MNMISATRMRAGAIGIGYQGHQIDQFVQHLLNQGVTWLVDIRLTPISRKPGFSKTALQAALNDVGISYEHRRELGNPKANRDGFAGSDSELGQAKARYAEALNTDAARVSLDELAGLARRERVAVLCFEADQHRCHRDVVLAHITRAATGVVSGAVAGSRRPAR